MIDPVGVSLIAPDEQRVLVALLEARFCRWWAAFLVHSLDTLKAFRSYGDDDRQILAWGLAVAAARAERDPSVARDGLSLSELAALTGVPVETARRHLLRLAQEGQCRRAGQHYAIDLSDALRARLVERARALAAVLVRELRPPVPVVTAHQESVLLEVYLAAGLAYSSNLRRRIMRGVFIPCVMAGMLEIEAVVRTHRLLDGAADESRQYHVEVVHRLNLIIVHTARLAHIAGESLARARAAVRHANDLGFGTLVSPDYFGYSAQATPILRDNQALVGGIRERLADLMTVAGAPALTVPK